MEQLSIKEFISAVATNSKVEQYALEEMSHYNFPDECVTIYKRDDDVFFKDLEKNCIGIKSRVAFSPIVTDSGYVLWVVGAYHSAILRLLSLLVSDGNFDYPDYFIKHNHGWYISSVRAFVVECGNAYKFNKSDEELVEQFFTLNRWPAF